VIEPNGARREIEISPLPFRIGRQPIMNFRCEIAASAAVRLNHCESSGALVLEDLGSRHGTFINGQKSSARSFIPGQY